MRPDGRPSGPGRPQGARVFFALWPEPDLAADLHRFANRIASKHGGRAMRAETLHVTLAFLGEQPLERLPEIEAIAAGVDAPDCNCRLDICGYWADKQLLWAGCREMDDNLLKLATMLTTALRQAGFAVERRPFKPHVTLVRKLRAGPAAWPELPAHDWRCRSFDLVQSVLQPQGAAYRKLASWPLAA